MISDEAWRRLTELTPARIALGRSGSGLPTTAAMKFALAHAQARDAVHTPLEPAEIVTGLESLRLAHVDHDGKPQRRGEPDLLAEDLLLDAARGEVVVVVQSDLAKGACEWPCFDFGLRLPRRR